MSGSANKSASKPAAAAATAKKFDAKKSISLYEFDPEKLNGVKVEKADIPGNKGSYQKMMMEYEYPDGETGELRIKWPDMDGCYIGKFTETKEGKEVTTYSITVYIDIEENKELLEKIADLANAQLAILESNKEHFVGSYDYTESNFDPSSPVTELWWGLHRKVKNNPKRRKLKFKTLMKGLAPDVKVVTQNKDAKAKTESIDSNILLSKKCKLRIVSKHPHIYVGEKIYPQNVLFSCLLLNFDESADVPEDLFDDDVADLNTKGVDMSGLMGKLATLKAGGLSAKPAAAGPGSTKTDEGKMHTGSDVKNKLSAIRERGGKGAVKKTVTPAAAKLPEADEGDNDGA